MDGATKEAIMNQVDLCPSKALSYKVAGKLDAPTIEEEQIVEVAPNGPLMVYGNIKVKHQGEEVSKNTVTAFCRCGASSNKPYCDGSHKKIGFEG